MKSIFRHIDKVRGQVLATRVNDSKQWTAKLGPNVVKTRAINSRNSVYWKQESPSDHNFQALIQNLEKAKELAKHNASGSLGIIEDKFNKIYQLLSQGSHLPYIEYHLAHLKEALILSGKWNDNLAQEIDKFHSKLIAAKVDIVSNPELVQKLKNQDVNQTAKERAHLIENFLWDDFTNKIEFFRINTPHLEFSRESASVLHSFIFTGEELLLLKEKIDKCNFPDEIKDEFMSTLNLVRIRITQNVSVAPTFQQNVSKLGRLIKDVGNDKISAEKLVEEVSQTNRELKELALELSSTQEISANSHEIFPSEHHPSMKAPGLERSKMIIPPDVQIEPYILNITEKKKKDIVEKAEDKKQDKPNNNDSNNKKWELLGYSGQGNVESDYLNNGLGTLGTYSARLYHTSCRRENSSGSDSQNGSAEKTPAHLIDDILKSEAKNQLPDEVKIAMLQVLNHTLSYSVEITRSPEHFSLLKQIHESVTEKSANPKEVLAALHRLEMAVSEIEQNEPVLSKLNAIKTPIEVVNNRVDPNAEISTKSINAPKIKTKRDYAMLLKHSKSVSKAQKGVCASKSDPKKTKSGKPIFSKHAFKSGKPDATVLQVEGAPLNDAKLPGLSSGTVRLTQSNPPSTKNTILDISKNKMAPTKPPPMETSKPATSSAKDSRNQIQTTDLLAKKPDVLASTDQKAADRPAPAVTTGTPTPNVQQNKKLTEASGLQAKRPEIFGSAAQMTSIPLAPAAASGTPTPNVMDSVKVPGSAPVMQAKQPEVLGSTAATPTPPASSVPSNATLADAVVLANKLEIPGGSVQKPSTPASKLSKTFTFMVKDSGKGNEVVSAAKPPQSFSPQGTSSTSLGSSTPSSKVQPTQLTTPTSSAKTPSSPNPTPSEKPTVPSAKPTSPGDKPTTPSTQPATPGVKPPAPGDKLTTPSAQPIPPDAKPTTPSKPDPNPQQTEKEKQSASSPKPDEKMQKSEKMNVSPDFLNVSFDKAENLKSDEKPASWMGASPLISKLSWIKKSGNPTSSAEEESTTDWSKEDKSVHASGHSDASSKESEETSEESSEIFESDSHKSRKWNLFTKSNEEHDEKDHTTMTSDEQEESTTLARKESFSSWGKMKSGNERAALASDEGEGEHDDSGSGEKEEGERVEDDDKGSAQGDSKVADEDSGDLPPPLIDRRVLILREESYPIHKSREEILAEKEQYLKQKEMEMEMERKKSAPREQLLKEQQEAIESDFNEHFTSGKLWEYPEYHPRYPKEPPEEKEEKSWTATVKADETPKTSEQSSSKSVVPPEPITSSDQPQPSASKPEENKIQPGPTSSTPPTVPSSPAGPTAQQDISKPAPESSASKAPGASGQQASPSQTANMEPSIDQPKAPSSPTPPPSQAATPAISQSQTPGLQAATSGSSQPPSPQTATPTIYLSQPPIPQAAIPGISQPPPPQAATPGLSQPPTPQAAIPGISQSSDTQLGLIPSSVQKKPEGPKFFTREEILNEKAKNVIPIKNDPVLKWENAKVTLQEERVQMKTKLKDIVQSYQMFQLKQERIKKIKHESFRLKTLEELIKLHEELSELSPPDQTIKQQMEEVMEKALQFITTTKEANYFPIRKAVTNAQAGLNKDPNGNNELFLKIIQELRNGIGPRSIPPRAIFFPNSDQAIERFLTILLQEISKTKKATSSSTPSSTTTTSTTASPKNKTIRNRITFKLIDSGAARKSREISRKLNEVAKIQNDLLHSAEMAIQIKRLTELMYFPAPVVSEIKEALQVTNASLLQFGESPEIRYSLINLKSALIEMSNQLPCQEVQEAAVLLKEVAESQLRNTESMTVSAEALQWMEIKRQIGEARKVLEDRMKESDVQNAFKKMEVSVDTLDDDIKEVLEALKLEKDRIEMVELLIALYESMSKHPDVTGAVRDRIVLTLNGTRKVVQKSKECLLLRPVLEDLLELLEQPEIGEEIIMEKIDAIQIAAKKLMVQATAAGAAK